MHSRIGEHLHIGCVTRTRRRAGISRRAAEGVAAARIPRIAAEVGRRTVQVTRTALTLRQAAGRALIAAWEPARHWGHVCESAVAELEGRLGRVGAIARMTTGNGAQGAEEDEEGPRPREEEERLHY